MFDLQLLVQVALGQPFEPSLEDRSFDGKPVANGIFSLIGLAAIISRPPRSLPTLNSSQRGLQTFPA
jgi:hypothetical protein